MVSFYLLNRRLNVENGKAILPKVGLCPTDILLAPTVLPQKKTVSVALDVMNWVFFGVIWY